MVMNLAQLRDLQQIMHVSSGRSLHLKWPKSARLQACASGHCRQNEAGTAAHKRGEWGDAFDHFSSAVRLAPQRAIYHSNRCCCNALTGKLACCMQDE